jgi:predicted AlkP superfamily pyrophosphatase or phosphodiesterase
MFWPGSEAEIRGVRPDYWQAFDAKVTPTQRVEQVLAWLDLPSDQRPDVMTLYFDQDDHEEHAHGPDSAQAKAARAQVDAALAQLLTGLHKRGLDGKINLIVVSDHGMAAVAPDHVLALEDMLPIDKVQIVSSGEVIGIEPRTGEQTTFDADIAPKLIGRHDHYQCWRKSELPPRWHYGSNPRVPAIVCQVDEGWDALPRKYIAERSNDGITRGSHGYDPALPSMQATFIANGPAFRSGTRLPTFDNVDIYPLLTRLLGITPVPNDGDITPLLPALKDARATK